MDGLLAAVADRARQHAEPAALPAVDRHGDGLGRKKEERDAGLVAWHARIRRELGSLERVTWRFSLESLRK